MSGLGTLNFGQLQFSANPAGTAGAAKDYGFPVFPNSSRSQGGIPVTVHCTEPWGTCNLEGQTIYVDPREMPQDGGTAGQDSHITLIDNASGREYDLWHTTWPESNGVLTVGWAGYCNLGSNGVGGCVGDASDTPITAGLIRAKDLIAAMQSPNGTLPYALRAAVMCSNGYVSPATNTDGHTSGCPPQGARAYLALHDADVNASGATALMKAILRTLDEDHYGLIITDTDGGQSGFQLQRENDTTYTAFGQAGPFATQIVPIAQSEGYAMNVSNNEYYLPLTATGINLANSMKFL
jgi:hypothetical protein